MLIVIDVGNTNTVFALYRQGKELLAQWRVTTVPKRTADEYGMLLQNLLGNKSLVLEDISYVMVASVVPTAIFPLRQFSKAYLKTEAQVIGEDALSYPISIDMPQPGEVGADRIVNAVAAQAMFGKAAIIVDFGTATTFDVLTSDARYIGGVIAPGIQLSLDTLHHAAAKLPKVSIERPATPIGKTTTEAMQAGIYWGYLGMVERLIKEIKAELKEPQTLVIATGGLAAFYGKDTGLFDHILPDLTIEGLRIIFEHNQGAAKSAISKL